jgi:hypothetical protein
MAITLRSGLGRKLTIAEMDENFTFLSGSYVVNSVTASMTAGSASVATRANGLAPTVTASFADTTTSASIATTAQTSSVATRANTLAPTATATSASTAVLAQTASVATRANALAPTVTATSASTAIAAQTASIATRANGLAPTVTATSASTAILAQTASVATRANALAPTVTATSASVAARATTLSAQATASFADVAGTVHDGNITNAKLANDSVTIGSTEVDLGATAASLTGLTSISAQTGSFVLQVFESASTIITSGSNIFGDKAADIQQITGSLLQTGSMTVIGNISASVGGFSGSFQGDGTLLTGVIASGSIQSASVAARATTLSPAATAASASTAVLAQTASVATRANGLAPTVTATSASTAIAAQTASVATRANGLAPTVTATSASVAARATTLSPAATASFADKADEAVTSNVIPVTVVDDGGNKYAFNGVTAPTLSLNRGERYRFDLSNASNDGHPFAFRLLDDTSYAVGVTTVGSAGNAGAYVDFDVNFATSASLKYYCTSHGNGMGNRAQIVDVLGGITSGSFSGSYQGDGSNITAVSAISSSTAVLAQTASVATRANALAPTVTATSASVAARATTLSAAATASFADLASNTRNLSISGSGAISGSLLITGSSALALRITGSTALTGSLLQSGSTQITGSTLLSGSLTITGSSAIGLRMSGSTALTGSIFQTGSFNVTGSTMLSGSLSITGSTNIIGAVSSSDTGRFKSLGINVAPSGVAGAILATNDVVAFASSDERLKENLEPIGSAVEKVEQITGYTYNWIPMEDIHVYGDMKDIGVIAQEVEKVLPEIVSDRENGYKAIKYDKLTAVLIQAVKELSNRVKTLENK